MFFASKTSDLRQKNLKISVSPFEYQVLFQVGFWRFIGVFSKLLESLEFFSNFGDYEVYVVCLVLHTAAVVRRCQHNHVRLVSYLRAIENIKNIKRNLQETERWYWFLRISAVSFSKWLTMSSTILLIPLSGSFGYHSSTAKILYIVYDCKNCILRPIYFQPKGEQNRKKWESRKNTQIGFMYGVLNYFKKLFIKLFLRFFFSFFAARRLLLMMLWWMPIWSSFSLFSLFNSVFLSFVCFFIVFLVFAFVARFEYFF